MPSSMVTDCAWQKRIIISENSADASPTRMKPSSPVASSRDQRHAEDRQHHRDQARRIGGLEATLPLLTP